MRFIATADWQLGMTAHYLDEHARPRYLEARFEAVRRIGELAAERDAEFVVVCGDVFESNQLDRRILSQTFEALRAFSVPVFLVPGNHDPLDAASIYDSPGFQQRCPSHVHVLRDSSPVQILDGVELVGAPWMSKRPLTDLLADATQALEPPSGGTLRILAGHGAASTLSPDADEPSVFEVAGLNQAITEGLVHCVVVGDKHSTTRVADRIWYPGTPEVTSRREPDPGNVLVIDVDADSTTVEPVHVGRWKFLVHEANLGSSADIDALQAHLEAVEDKSRTALWLKLVGSLSTAQHSRLEQLLEEHSELFAKLSNWERHKDLVVVPDDADFSSLGLTGFATDAIAELVERSGSLDDDDAAASQDALGLLYRFVGGTR